MPQFSMKMDQAQKLFSYSTTTTSTPTTNLLTRYSRNPAEHFTILAVHVFVCSPDTLSNDFEAPKL